MTNYTASPEDYGVVAGVVSPAQAAANTIALASAISDNKLIDGAGRSYDVSGQVRATKSTRFRNMIIRQVSADASILNTVLCDGLEFVEIDNVTVDINGLKQSQGFGQCSGVAITVCGRSRCNNLKVINGGAITGVKHVQVADAQVSGGGVSNFTPAPYAAEPTDDVCQAYEFQLCSNFRIEGTDSHDLAATWAGQPTPRRQYSRGIVAGQSDGGLIHDNKVGPNIEQLIDISGYENRNIIVSNNLLPDAGTWGIKCANQFRGISILGNKIVRPGYAGVVCSAAGSTDVSQPSGVLVADNDILNPGASGLWPARTGAFGTSGPTGVAVFGRDIATPGFPEGVIIQGNRIKDDQTTPTMLRGLDMVQVNSASPNLPDSAFPILTNREMSLDIDNIVARPLIERQRGFPYPRCRLQEPATTTLVNNVWTSISFTGSDADDTSGMHDPAGSNPSWVVVRETGSYSISGQFIHDNVAGGVRGARVLVNGGAAFGQHRVPAVGTSFVTEVSLVPIALLLRAGDRVELQAYQNSGGTIGPKTVQATLDVVLAQRGG